jgi:hypothetical protein
LESNVRLTKELIRYTSEDEIEKKAFQIHCSNEGYTAAFIILGIFDRIIVFYRTEGRSRWFTTSGQLFQHEGDNIKHIYRAL